MASQRIHFRILLHCFEFQIKFIVCFWVAIYTRARRTFYKSGQIVLNIFYDILTKFLQSFLKAHQKLFLQMTRDVT